DDDGVLIEVGACALNATDINTRVGWYAIDDDNGAWDAPISFPRIQGADVCGRVVARGKAVPSELLGRRVVVDPWVRDDERPLDLTRCRYLGSELDGGYAEYVAVPARNSYPVESAMSDVELASFATAFGTALNMVRRAGVQPGQDVLVTGASGGVGDALIQFVGLAGARSIGLCHPAKADVVRASGAAVTIDRTADLTEALLARTGRNEVDCILDVVGGERWPDLIRVLARGGTYAVAGAIAGPWVPLDLRTLYLRDLTFVGVTVTPPGLFADLVRHVERGEVRHVVSGVYTFDHVHDAQRAFADRRRTGKLVLHGWS
ncbi:MAG TPA: zinc-binding dehydrogenase, partial [Acidimicrobiales bacterium]